MTRKLRIIGGEWRSRVLSFPEVNAIRPTPDRVRETLFNWLQNHINGAKCLELFAGSGILSLEALSRGADHCTIVDQSNAAISAINHHLVKLKAASTRASVLETDARHWLTGANPGFDIIFLDPPFADEGLAVLLERCLRVLNEDGRLYVETPLPLEDSESYEILKQKRAGAVHFCLITHPFNQGGI